MGLTDKELKEIAKNLSGKVGKNSDARSRLLCVQELLRNATNERRGLTAGEMTKILSYRASDGKLPSEPTVLEDIHAVCTNEPFGMQIEAPTRGKVGGFKCKNGNEEIKVEKVEPQPVSAEANAEKGEPAELFFLVSLDVKDEALARFGKKNKLENVVDNKGYLRVQVELTQSFFQWLFGKQGSVKIVSPGTDIWNRTGSWAKLSTASRNARELRLDYEKATGRFKDMLEHAQDAIG